ncbi:MAG: ribonuclease P protein component [Oscillospiraceae bacterium]|jgi:ribonuclease P protein component|nr:ribonuclease P protein component [Oscillospiraceae bacterium]
MEGYGKKYAIVRKNREFQFLFQKGNNFVTYAFACYHRANNRRVNRLGIVASKKVGGAVKRNRAKRVIREAFRLAEPELRAKTEKRFDFVFVARGKTPYVKSTAVCGLMKNFMDRLV